jgi:hypothetical protein
MFIPFFLELKAVRVPVTLREFLTLLEGTRTDLVTYDVEGFYHLALGAGEGRAAYSASACIR